MAYHNGMISLQGHLLVSAPELPDVFAQSVVLMVRHNEDGAFGLILNRLTDLTVREIWSKVSQAPCQVDARLHVGGPVEGPLMAIYSQMASQELEVLPGLYFSHNPDTLQELTRSEKMQTRAKYFIGYAGWTSGQLEEEIERGSWQVLPARMEHVFDGDDQLWATVRRELADHALRSQLHIKHVPPDLRMN